MPRWRENAEQREAEGAEAIEPASDAAELLDRFERALPVEADVAADAEDADYFVIRRQVPVKKGKWRLLPEELEERDGDD
jgi:hypothetical protein